MGADRLGEIRARLNAATPGPWFATEDLDEYDSESAVGVAVAEPWAMIVVTPGGGSFDIGAGLEARVANAVFIAHARTDIPWLLDEIERLTAERDAFTAAYERLHLATFGVSAASGEGSEQ